MAKNMFRTVGGAWRKAIFSGAVLLCTAAILSSCGGGHLANEGAEDVISQMSLDEKLSQMIIPAIRTWNDVEVTDLDEAPGLVEALRKHQYGGIILFGQNIKDTEQTARLVSGLQQNNLRSEAVSEHIPYLMPLDEEGGIVIRLTSGTRMTGNMAIAATGSKAEENAATTGRIIGEELSALGFNADFAPVVDVNNNAANPVIGVRSFSDDPETVAKLGVKYMNGLAEAGIAATCKHFPGHGDTDVDSHIGAPMVDKAYEELQKTELVPFKAMVENGVDLIMTAHITFPGIDVSVTYADGTDGYYPATMSKKIITDILRGDLGYDGVVVTDALEMDAIMGSALVEGESGSADYMANISEKVIGAGVDMLLIPKDMKDEEAVSFYDDYISNLEAKVEDGAIPMERIDESVSRILKLKEKYGIEASAYSGNETEDSVDQAKSVVGSTAHHEAEMEIAREAVTVLKNDGNTLPLSQEAQTPVSKVVLLGRLETDKTLAESAMSQLKDEGVIDADTEVSFDYYIEPDPEGEKLRYTEEMAGKIHDADVVIGMTQTYNADALAEEAPSYQAIRRAIDDAHEGGGKFVLLSCRIPYDAARFQDADAIVLAYLSAGMDTDPTAAGGDLAGAYNANVVAALEIIAGKTEATGTLPVDIPGITVNEDGSIAYSDELLYKRGFGLSATETNQQIAGKATAFSKLPAYAYDGEPQIAAICDYLTQKIASDYDAADVSIPYLKVVDEDDTNPEDTKVWGDFWVMNYDLNGDVLEMVSGGNCPGLMHLQKNEDGSFAVTDFEVVEDGSSYVPSAKKIFGDKYEDFAEVQADDKAMEKIRAAFIKDYVDANGLNITAYKDYGWDPVTLE